MLESIYDKSIWLICINCLDDSWRKLWAIGYILKSQQLSYKTSYPFFCFLYFSKNMHLQKRCKYRREQECPLSQNLETRYENKLGYGNN